MKADFPSIVRLAALLARPFSESFFRLLATYESVSASEAASMLDLHIQTAQEFLEGLNREGIVNREEVSEGKRPYYRYALIKDQITLRINLKDLRERASREDLDDLIRERKNSGALFKEGAGPGFISSVTLFEGEGRRRKERKINLTNKQGRFLYHLPFPNSEPRSIKSLLKKAGLDRGDLPEIMDLLDLLIVYEIIEIKER